MIGKAEWFKRRKWAGWGLYPATKEGWIYVALFVVLIFGTQFLPAPEKIKMSALAIVAVIMIADTIHIMAKMKKDERETLHEAIAERNALWTIIFVLAVGVAYQAAQSVLTEGAPTIDPVIIIAIFAGLITKAVTNYHLDKKD